MSCAVKGCSNCRRLTVGDISFHLFPTNKDLQEEWLKVLNIDKERWVWSKNKIVCSKHFKKNDFMGTFTRRLQPNCIPSLNLTNSTAAGLYNRTLSSSLQTEVSTSKSMVQESNTSSLSDETEMQVQRRRKRKLNPSFPKDHLLKKWLKILNLKNWQWTPNKFICSKHFLHTDFIKGAQRTRLKINAVPSICLTGISALSSATASYEVPKRERLQSESSNDSLTPPPSPHRIAPSRKLSFPEIQISDVRTVWDDDPLDANYKQKRKMLPSTSSKNQLEFETVVENVDETSAEEEKSAMNNSCPTTLPPAANAQSSSLNSKIIESKNSPIIQPVPQLVLLPASITNPATLMVVPQAVQASNLIFQGLPLVSTGNLTSNSVGIVCNNSLANNMVYAGSAGRSVLKNNLLSGPVAKPLVTSDTVTLNNNLLSNTFVKEVNVGSSNSSTLKLPNEIPKRTPKLTAKSGNHLEKNDSITEINGRSTPELAEEWEKVGSIEIKKRKPLPRYFGDISSDDMDSPPRARVSLNVARKTVSSLKGKVRSLLKQNRRLKEKVKSMKKLYCYLEDNNYLNQYAKAAIKAVMPDEVDSIFESEPTNEEKDHS